jgi:hypothetical protein
LTCSSINALPSFSGTSMISSSSGFVVEGTFRKSGVVHSSKTVNPVLFVFGSHAFCIPEIYRSFLMTSLRILSSLVYPLTLLRKRISAASRQFTYRFVVVHVSLP